MSDSPNHHRWREVDRMMCDDGGRRSGVQGLALALFDAVERLPPDQLRAFADETTGVLNQDLVGQSEVKGRA